MACLTTKAFHWLAKCYWIRVQSMERTGWEPQLIPPLPPNRGRLGPAYPYLPKLKTRAL